MLNIEKNNNQVTFYSNVMPKEIHPIDLIP